MFKSLFGSSPATPSGEKAPSLLDRLKLGVQKTRAGLMEKIEDAVHGKDRKSTRLNSSHSQQSRMPSSA